MGLKRRKLSPSASSQSSTPGPSISAPGPSRYLPQSSPPAPDTQSGPSRFSDSGTPGPSPAPVQSLGLAQTQGRAKIQDDRTIAKPGIIIAGSGDGGEVGEECYLWNDLPMNKNGYRYLPCGPSPNKSPSTIFPFYRVIPFPPSTPPVHISWLDRSHFLRLSQNALTATTDRGYRSGRANVSVREGTWYFEAEVLRGDAEAGAAKGSWGEVGNAHVRVGWGRREAGLDAPVGADGYAYGLRDVGGETIHVSRSGKSGSGKGYGTGDIVGCLISLPKRSEIPVQEIDPISASTRDLRDVDYHRRRVSIRYKASNYFEMEEYPVQKEMEALVDRDGKYAQARIDMDMAAAKAAANGGGPGGEKGEGGGGGGLPGPKGKKTKNTKKGKQPPEPKKKDIAPVEVNPLSTFRPLRRLPNSRIEFFINGSSTGIAYENLYDYIPLPPIPTLTKKHTLDKDDIPDDGTLGYYPMISCFGRGKLKLNFGPDFKYPQEGARGMSERWEEFKEEERLFDEREEEEMRDFLIKEEEEDKKRAEAVQTKLAKKASAVSAKKAAAEASAAKMGKGVGGSPLSGKGRVGTGTPTPSISSKLARAPGSFTPESTVPPVDTTLINDNEPGDENGDARGEEDVEMISIAEIREAGTETKSGMASRAGSTPASPTPTGTPTPTTGMQRKGKLLPRKKPGPKLKAKRKAKPKSKLSDTYGGGEDSRATSVITTTPTTTHTPDTPIRADTADEDAEGEVDLEVRTDEDQSIAVVDADDEDAEGEVDEGMEVDHSHSEPGGRRVEHGDGDEDEDAEGESDDAYD